MNTYNYGAFDRMLLSYHVRVSESIYTMGCRLSVLTTQLNHLSNLTKWLNFRLQTKWFLVRIKRLLLKVEISRLF